MARRNITLSHDAVSLSREFEVGRAGYHEAAALTPEVPDMGNIFADHSDPNVLNAILREELERTGDEGISSAGYAAQRTSGSMNAQEKRQKEQEANRSIYIQTLMAQLHRDLQDKIDGLNAQIDDTDRVLGRMESGEFDIDGNEEDAQWFAKFSEETGTTREDWDEMSEGERVEATTNYRDGLEEQRNDLQSVLDKIENDSDSVLSMTGGVFDEPWVEEAVQVLESQNNDFDRMNLSDEDVFQIYKQLTAAKSDVTLEVVELDEINLEADSGLTEEVKSVSLDIMTYG